LALLFVVGLPSRAVLAQEAAIIVVTLTDSEGWPVVGVEIAFVYENGQDGGACVTDGSGQCQIAPSDVPTGLVRGYLEVGSAGRRSLIWPGGIVQVALQLEPDGSLYVATEPIGGEPTATLDAGGGEGAPELFPTPQQFPAPETTATGVPASSVAPPTPTAALPTTLEATLTPALTPTREMISTPATLTGGYSTTVLVFLIVLAVFGAALVGWGLSRRRQ